ncbi:hypothetical protein Tco_1297347 [Tanacetum coccineum]
MCGWGPRGKALKKEEVQSYLVLERPVFILNCHKRRRTGFMQTFGQQHILQGLPKDIYSLINHYIDAKDIWDNVKMLLEGSELTKEDRESQLIERFKLLITYLLYMKQHEAHANENKMMLERLTQQTVDPLALMSNVSHQPVGTELRKGNNRCERGPGEQEQLVMGEHRTEWGMLIRLLFLAGGHDNAIDEDMDEQPVQDLALNVDNVFQADDCDAYDSDVDEAPTAQTLFMANLSSANPVYDEAGPSYDLDVLSEVQYHDHYQDAVCDHHDKHEMHDDVQPNHVVDSHADYTSDSNMTLYDQYVKDNAVLVVQNNASMVPNDAYVMIV